MQKKILWTTLMVCVLWITLAHADEKFTAMDSNKDGKISWDEFMAAYPQMQKAAFEAIDINKDTTLSPEEWEMFMARHQMGKMNQGGMGGGMGSDMTGKGERPAAPGHGGAAPLITPPVK